MFIAYTNVLPPTHLYLLYKSSAIIELLLMPSGDFILVSFPQAVNRVLLRWVKMWDFVVFKKEKPLKRNISAAKFKPKPPGETKDGKKAFNKASYQEFIKKKYEDLGLEDEFDSVYRPVQKVSRRYNHVVSNLTRCY